MAGISKEKLIRAIDAFNRVLTSIGKPQIDIDTVTQDELKEKMRIIRLIIHPDRVTDETTKKIYEEYVQSAAQAYGTIHEWLEAGRSFLSNESEGNRDIHVEVACEDTSDFRESGLEISDDEEVWFCVKVKSEDPITSIVLYIDNEAVWRWAAEREKVEHELYTSKKEGEESKDPKNAKTFGPYGIGTHYFWAEVRTRNPQTGWPDNFSSNQRSFKVTGLKTIHKDRPRWRSPYQQGALRGGKDSAVGVLRTGWFKHRIKEKQGHSGRLENIKIDPHLHAAVNKGKRIMNRRAAAEFRKLWKPLKKEFKQKHKELRTLKTNARKARRKVWKHMKFWQRMRIPVMGPRDVLNEADSLANNPAITEAIRDEIKTARDMLKEYLDKRDKYEEDFNKKLDTLSNDLKEYMEKVARVVGIGLARRYKFPLHPYVKKDVEGIAAAGIQEGTHDTLALYAELYTYATEISEDFITRGRTMGFALLRGLTNISRGAETFAGSYFNITRNFWDLITGPWTIGAIFVIIQYFFMLRYIGFNTTYLYVLPLIAGGVLFIINFANTQRALDIFTHLFAGMIIGQGVIIFMLSLGLTQQFLTVYGFIIIWIIFGFIGAFEFYPTGGHKVIFQIAVIVLLFGYITFGPFQAEWQVVTGQIKAPIKTIYYTGREAVTSLWLLATNPTEYMKRQQLINVRPDRPISFPSALELKTLDSLPESVPGGESFALIAVVQNEATNSVRDLSTQVACNAWCTVESGPIEKPPKLIRPGEQVRIDYPKFMGYIESNRQAETRLAKVFFNISYRHSTNSTLIVSVISKGELDRRFKLGEVVFKTVTAVGSGTPAQLSLNVGPQPLQSSIVEPEEKEFAAKSRFLQCKTSDSERCAEYPKDICSDGYVINQFDYLADCMNAIGQETTTVRAGVRRALLLISVSNGRNDGHVLLKKNQKIVLHLPSTIGKNLVCDGRKAQFDDKIQEEHLEYGIPKDIDIRPRDFNSIFAVLCRFDVASVDEVQTGLIRAELQDYTFVLTKEKQVKVTAPLGILYDPYDKICSQCGDQGCNEKLCTTLSGSEGRCYWKTAGMPDICTSCRINNPDCGIFREPDCGPNKASNKQCEYNCAWKTSDELIAEGQSIDSRASVEGGKCVFKGLSCQGLNEKFKKGYEQFGTFITEAINKNNFDMPDVDENALAAAIITIESGWNPDAYNPSDPSYGLMAITPSTATYLGCDLNAIKISPQANIDCGVKHLAQFSKKSDINEYKLYKCKNIQYKGKDAVLRYYNGWPDSCAGNKNYVEEVNEKYTGWVNCFEQDEFGVAPIGEMWGCFDIISTPSPDAMTMFSLEPKSCFEKRSDCKAACPSSINQQCLTVDVSKCPVGTGNFCKMKKETTRGCKAGQGPCNEDIECDVLEKRLKGDLYPLTCRKVDNIPVKVCCFGKGDEPSEILKDLNQECIDKYNMFTGT